MQLRTRDGQENPRQLATEKAIGEPAMLKLTAARIAEVLDNEAVPVLRRPPRVQCHGEGARRMSLVLELPPELETELAAEAKQLGLSISEYALRLLAGGGGPRPKLRTGAELIAYWEREGLVGTRPDIDDSQAHARDLREQAQKRTR
jgi:hypothetical protein